MIEDKKKRRAALGIIFLTVFIDLVGFGIIIPLSPYLARQFDASPFEIGLLMSVYSLMQFLFAPVWGRISDRIGRRPIILMSLLGSSLSYFGFAYATTLLGLFIARIFAGIFGASISTAAAYIADVTPKEERSKGMGMIGAAFGLGFIFGPFLGGVAGTYGETLGNQPPFGMSFSAVVAGAICLLNFLVAIRTLQESLPKELRGKAEAKKSRVTLITQCLRKEVIGAMLLVFFLHTLAMANMESTLFLFVKDRFDWGVQLASYGFACVGLMMAFTQGYLIRKILPKWGERKTLVVGLALAAIGMSGIAFSGTIAILAATNLVLALGVGLTHPSVMGILSLKAEDSEQGMVLGVAQSVSALGRIVGPAIGGWIYGEVAITSPYLFAGSLMALGLIVVLVIHAKIPQLAKQAEA